MEHERDTVSLEGRLKNSLRLFCCCFGSSSHRQHPAPTTDTHGVDKPRLIRASSTWLRSRVQELPNISDKYRNLISRIGPNASRRGSTEFTYDALNYALNFDDDDGGGGDDSRAEDFPLRNFSARLPLSPPPPTTEIAACRED